LAAVCAMAGAAGKAATRTAAAISFRRVRAVFKINLLGMQAHLKVLVGWQ
jgi:hypothetical protein